MWYEYRLMPPKDALQHFADMYQAYLEIYIEQVNGTKPKVFHKNKNVTQHRNFNTFIKLKDTADKYLIKYDDWWELAFDVLRDNGNFRFFGITSFSNQQLILNIVAKEQIKYENRLKLASSHRFSAKFYSHTDKVLNDYFKYLVSQVKLKYPANMYEVLKDLIVTEKLSIDFLKNNDYIVYNELIKRFPRHFKGE